MSTTNIESSIMEMLEPKVKEIQDRFSKGEKLGLQDFNLLLLKTQYNHLDHLDHKLNEVADDVASLKTEVTGLKTEFIYFKNEINLKLDNFKNEIEYKIQKAINVNMRWSIGIIAFIVTVLKVIDMMIK